MSTCCKFLYFIYHWQLSGQLRITKCFDFSMGSSTPSFKLRMKWLNWTWSIQLNSAHLYRGIIHWLSSTVFLTCPFYSPTKKALAINIGPLIAIIKISQLINGRALVTFFITPRSHKELFHTTSQLNWIKMWVIKNPI